PNWLGTCWLARLSRVAWIWVCGRSGVNTITFGPRLPPVFGRPGSPKSWPAVLGEAVLRPAVAALAAPAVAALPATSASAATTTAAARRGRKRRSGRWRLAPAGFAMPTRHRDLIMFTAP